MSKRKSVSRSNAGFRSKVEQRIRPEPPLLPRRAPLKMPAQSFGERTYLRHTEKRRHAWIPRAAIVLATTLMTFAFAYELYGALSVSSITPLQIVFLILSTLAFAWIALGTLSASFGFLHLFGNEVADTIELPDAVHRPAKKTALLFPVYHEDPSLIAGTIEAIAEDLEHLRMSDRFDVFVLSDTRGDYGREERRAYAALRRELAGRMQVYYRRRLENSARKAGNIKNWIENFGARYPSFVILDGDSVMSGKTLVRLTTAMHNTPHAGLIQTVPRLAGGTTILQQMQQFASSVYGQAVAAGLAVWHADEGNYWGHNAIIRTTAFANAAGLPDLPGRPPLGGHIQSHDFVEAALMQRAGWEIHLAATPDGSFEGSPPTLSELIVRDRRWAQGNLQHLRILFSAALTPMGRTHLLFGACSYLVSLVWASTLVVGLMLALQSEHLIPTYFKDEKTLFPIWPIIDNGAALQLFVATLTVVLLPKVLGLILEIRRADIAREKNGALRAAAGVLAETILSMLMAPIFMMTQSRAVLEVLSGRDSGWKAQQRVDGRLPLASAINAYWPLMAIGAAAIIVSWTVSIELVAWMAPVLLGLVLAGPVVWFTAKPAGPVLRYLLSTPQERTCPPVLEHAHQYARAWAARMAELTDTVTEGRSPTAGRRGLARQT